MAKLVLTQIVKNESHVVTRMLDSIKTIVDMVCIVDTGSTDNTIEVINNWGKENNIETHVFERPFDDFEKSRNHSFEKAREILKDRNIDEWWGFWLDADEVIEIDDKFNKNNISKDLYMFNSFLNHMKYTRNEMYKLSKPFRFYGPIHEYIVCDDQNVTSGVLEGISVKVRMDGGSWQGDIPTKYLSHAHVLEKYISDNRKDPRWIFYTAQSYHDSACIPNNKEENDERLRRSIKYYKERTTRTDGYPEEIYYSQLRIGSIMRSIEAPWKETHSELLKAYNLDPMRGEAIKEIIDHYLKMQEWNLAYLYSKLGKVKYHGRNPYPHRLLFVNEALYVWQFLEVHAVACYYSGNKDEAVSTYTELMKVLETSPQSFTEEERNKIITNQQYFK